MRKPLAITCTLLMALVLAPSALASANTTSDAQDADELDVESISHADTDGVVKYTVRTFSAVRADDVAEMAWELDLDGDRAVRGADDACVVMEAVRGTRKLRAGILKGCEGTAFTTADARVKDRTIKLRLLVSELEHAGLDDDAASYAYRFTSVGRNGARDVVPDIGGLITHSLSGRGSSASDAQAAQVTATPSASPTAKPTATPKSGRDTTSSGTADESTIEPGDDVDIEGSGFARHKGLQIFLTGNATSTASASPTPTASPSVSPTASPTASPTPSRSPATQSFSRTSSSGTRSGEVVVGQSVGGTDASSSGQRATAAESGTAQAAAAERIRLGLAISDDDGNFEDDVEIPDDTKAGSYRILVEGPNPRGGTNTVTIPIKVAAQVEEDDDDDAGDPATNVNATGTATQASPVAAGGGGGANDGSSQLPTTGSNGLQTVFGLGVLALVLGASMVLAKRIAGNRPALAVAAPATPDAPSVWVRPARQVFETSIELRGEMQRLLARRTDRYDPDRHADL